MAVIERFGERLGVRRGSHSSGSSDAGSSSVASGHTRAGGLAAAVRRRSRRLSRSTTRDSSPDRPKRQHLPRKRQFTLLLPPPDATAAAALTTGGDALNPLSRVNTPRGSDSSTTYLDEAISAGGSGTADRLITTPDLAVVLDKIRALRLAAGVVPETPPVTPGAEVGPARRGGSAPGRSRPRLRQGPGVSFPNPPIMRAAVPRSKSRLEILRGPSTADVPRPKSVSDLMGMTNPYGSSTSLSAMRSGSDFKMPTRAATLSADPAMKPGAIRKEESGKGCWWLDVACPGWEDLRDIGEVSRVKNTFGLRLITSCLDSTLSPSRMFYSKTRGRSLTLSIDSGTTLSSYGPWTRSTLSIRQGQQRPWWARARRSSSRSRL
jgi:hypothetical protein